MHDVNATGNIYFFEAEICPVFCTGNPLIFREIKNQIYG